MWHTTLPTCYRPEEARWRGPGNKDSHLVYRTLLNSALGPLSLTFLIGAEPLGWREGSKWEIKDIGK